MFVLLALCIIFRIFPESKTRTDESRADEFEADWVVELDRVGTNITPSRSCQKFSKQICLWDLVRIIGILFIIQIVEAI